MDTRIAVTGGRDYTLKPDDFAFLAEAVARFSPAELLSGGARGVDAAVEDWAKHQGIRIRRICPDWKQGKFAGFLNNERIAREANVLVAFPSKRGTSHMVTYCRSHGWTFSSRRRASAPVPSATGQIECRPVSTRRHRLGSILSSSYATSAMLHVYSLLQYVSQNFLYVRVHAWRSAFAISSDVQNGYVPGTEEDR